jgi:hypothetical protein
MEAREKMYRQKEKKKQKGKKKKNKRENDRRRKVIREKDIGGCPSQLKQGVSITLLLPN